MKTQRTSDALSLLYQLPLANCCTLASMLYRPLITAPLCSTCLRTAMCPLHPNLCTTPPFMPNTLCASHHPPLVSPLAPLIPHSCAFAHVLPFCPRTSRPGHLPICTLAPFAPASLTHTSLAISCALYSLSLLRRLPLPHRASPTCVLSPPCAHALLSL